MNKLKILVIKLLLIAMVTPGQAEIPLHSVGRSGQSMPTVGSPNQSSPVISDLNDFTGGSLVGALQCNPSPDVDTKILLSPENNVCDAPIVFVINTIDQLATKVAQQCLPMLYAKLPDYAKDLKVLGALASGNPIAFGIALGTTVEGDLRACGFDGVLNGLPVPDKVRTDLKNINQAIKTTSEYLSLKENMSKLLNLKEQAIDASTLAGEVRDAYIGHREVEGIGKNIADLGKGLAGKFKDAAKDVSTLQKGVDGLQSLLNSATQAMQDHEDLAENFRNSARNDVTKCKIENADYKLVSAAERAKYKLQQTQQALANVYELRVCIAEQIQAEVGSSREWLLAATLQAKDNYGLALKLNQFRNSLPLEIHKLDNEVHRLSNLIENIARQCSILHKESQYIQQTLDTYAQISDSIDERLTDPLFCRFSNLHDRINHLKIIENDRCGRQLPLASTSQPMSNVFIARLLKRKRNVEVDQALLNSLKTEMQRAIEHHDIKKASQLLDSLAHVTKNPCIDDKIVDTLKKQLELAKNSPSKSENLPTSVSAVGSWSWFNGGIVNLTDNGKILVNGKQTGTYTCAGSLCKFIWYGGKYRDTLKLSADGQKLDGKNQNGTHVWGERVKNAGIDPDLTSNSDKTACFSISAQKGWQDATIPGQFSGNLLVTGGWNVHSSHPLAGPEGYQGALEERMDRQYKRHKYAKSMPFAALLMRNGSSGNVQWIKLKQSKILIAGNKLQFRINDNDDALSDNRGQLKVCLH